MPSKPAPRVVVVEGTPAELTATYVQIPGLSPEVAALVAGHVERARVLASLAMQAIAALGELTDAAARERAELARTHRALTSKRNKRRR